MKRITLIVAMLVLTLGAAKPAAAQGRYIVRTTGGLSSVLNLCNLLKCQVQGGLDGPIGQTFLVTSTNNLLDNLVNGAIKLVQSLLGIVSVEADRLLPIPLAPLPSIPSGLYDNAPVNYYGAVAWHGYVAQPAAQIIRLQDAQNGFRIGGSGIVAVIDTGVDVNHPVLSAVLIPGYDFTRKQPGASEWLDVSGLQNGPTNTGAQQPGYVQQSTAAVLDQSTAAVLDDKNYTAFGHGTMTSGLIHLVAPRAKILPLKAFSSDGTGNLSNIIAALYYAVQQHANVVNMSFDVPAFSPALNQAAAYANKAGVVLVAAAGNGSTSAPVYPAALNSYVVGIASTTNWDSRSSFSNYGSRDVWIAAPGENIVSTFPGGTYASASGTSFSSPIVAGTVSLLLSAKQQTINQSQAASALSHGRPLTSDLNRGRLDVYQAVSAWVNSSGSTSGSGSCSLLCW
ncbi:MAG: S8 family serine peptidase [Candidatus Acidiferrum sp.]